MSDSLTTVNANFFVEVKIHAAAIHLHVVARLYSDAVLGLPVLSRLLLLLASTDRFRDGYHIVRQLVITLKRVVFSFNGILRFRNLLRHLFGQSQPFLLLAYLVWLQAIE